MSVTPELVRSMARLARLDLDAGEADRLAGDLDRIVGYFDRLRALDDSGEAGGPSTETAPLRADLPSGGTKAGLIEGLAPDVRRGYVAVPRVVSRTESGEEGT